MNKPDLINKIKKIGLLQTIDDFCGNFFSYLKYKLCLATNKVYFGSYLAAKQGQSARHCYMQMLVENYCREVNEKIAILEIGSWAGGSTITWAEAIKKYSVHSGIVVCIDRWVNYFASLETKLWTHKTMEKALRKNKIYNLFLHNILASGYNEIVFTFKGPSSQNLTLLRENQFDIIFIDGDHLYGSVYSDIEKSAALLKNGGIICGDDLELQYPAVSEGNLKKILNTDVNIDSLTNKRFHPGVTLAVWEYFKGEVSCWSGFWAMKKKGNSWEKVILSRGKESSILPKHLR